MADEDKDSKTEDPSEKKTSRRRREGQYPASTEASLFASSLAFYVYLVFFAPDGAKRLGESLKDVIERPEQWRLNTAGDLVSLGLHLAKEAGALLLPAAIMFIIFGLGQSFAQNMPQFVLDRINPKAERISPVKGFQRIYSVNGLVNFGKSLFKVVVVAIIMGIVLKNDYFKLLTALISDPQLIVPTGYENLEENDDRHSLLYRYSCGGRLLLEPSSLVRETEDDKQEVKDEHKQSQGDPVVKARQRSIARDRARRRMMDAVPRATLIIHQPDSLRGGAALRA